MFLTLSYEQIAQINGLGTIYFIPITLMNEELDNLEVWENETTDTVGTPEEDNSHTDEEASKIARYKEQMKGSQEEAMRLRNLAIDQWVKAAENDARSLLDLHDVDPKLADEVARKFGYDDFADAKKFIDQKFNNSDWIKENKSGSEADFERWYQERKAKETDSEARARAEKIFAKEIKDEELREKAKAQFKRIAWNKKLSMEEAEEFAEMATLYVNKDNMRANMYEDWLWSFASTWMWMWKKPSSQWSNMVVRNGRLVDLNSNN